MACDSGGLDTQVSLARDRAWTSSSTLVMHRIGKGLRYVPQDEDEGSPQSEHFRHGASTERMRPSEYLKIGLYSSTRPKSSYVQPYRSHIAAIPQPYRSHTAAILQPYRSHTAAILQDILEVSQYIYLRKWGRPCEGPTCVSAVILRITCMRSRQNSPLSCVSRPESLCRIIVNMKSCLGNCEYNFGWNGP